MEKNNLIPTYPQIGDVIYWKDDYDGNMHEDIVLKKEDECLYIEIYENGASFVTIDDILDPLSEEVQKFKMKLHKEKMDKLMKMINIPEIYCELRKRLAIVYSNEADNILKTLINESI